MPCRDLGRTVGEAVESVLAQTRPADELVVVDDGSTDVYTRQALQALGRAGVRVVRTATRGLAAARNHGIRLSTAPYLVALDADDLLEPTYLAKTAARLDAEPGLDFVTTAMRAFEGASYVWTPPPLDLAHAFSRGTAHQSTMFRRSVWESVGGFDEASPIHGCEDLDFFVSAMERGCRGAVLDEPLLRYRVRADSMHQRSVALGRHRAAMAALLEKHRATIEARGPELLLDTEAFLVELKAYRGSLVARKTELERELRDLDAEIAALAGALRARGRAPVEWGDLRRLAPLSPRWGVERGKPIDRLYIERFLDRHRGDIRGRVLEVKDPGYAEWFGGARVTAREVLDVDAANPRATIVADLARADTIPADRFDCFILTQTLHIIYDVRAALAHAHRILRPGGVILCTLPAVSRVNPEDGGLDGGDYWRFTEASVRRLFAEVFPPESFEVSVEGNVLACAAFLYGLAAEDLEPAELDQRDPWFPLLFCVRAVKPAGAAA